MDYVDFFSKVLLLIGTGIILLRISGRKSISQMTIAQTVIMISIGSLIIQPIVDKSLVRTLGAAAIFVGFLILLEYLQLKFDFIESFITGKAKIVIKNGEIQTKTLKKLRLTVDQLEIRLRGKGISKISDIKTATLEANGQIGYELKDYAKPLTKGEFEMLMSEFITKQSKAKPKTKDIFQEVIIKEKNSKNNKFKQ